MQRLIVVLDACVLVPMPLCDTLLRAAEQNLYTFVTSSEIIEETNRNLQKILIKNNKLDEKIARQKAENRTAQMLRAFPGSIVEPDPEIIGRLENDPKDRHVLAVAIKARENYANDCLTFIVTNNLKDFPEATLEPHGIQALSPDDFLCFLLRFKDRDGVLNLLKQQANDRYEGDLLALVERLESNLIKKLAIEIRSLIS